MNKENGDRGRHKPELIPYAEVTAYVRKYREKFELYCLSQ